VAQAARLAKRSRTDFYNLLARYRLHPEDFKNEGSPHRKVADADEKVTDADEENEHE
jgi:hypothetical protein